MPQSNGIFISWQSLVAMVEWLGCRTPNHKIVDSSPIKTSWLIKNHRVWATSDDNGASVHTAVNEYLAIDRDGNRTYITCGALNRVSGCMLPRELSR